ncbi:hypothetical protein ASG29_08165 [Sphingomonas sp. Leaf412]|nr:hypothetical protein ASG29_08165 [Sphingomonas sp. Leaf412]
MIAPLALAAAVPCAALPQSAPLAASAVPGPAYADIADLVVASPLVIDATIRSDARIKGAEAAGVPAGQARSYVEADVTQLIRGTAAIPSRIGWVVDVPLDFRGRAPKLKKARVLIFARPVAGNPGQVQLVTPSAQLPWSPAAEATARRIATEANAPDAPPVVTGIRNAFHVPGSLPGEGETQIFLQTRDGAPAALSVLRRPGEAPRWSVALGEIIDDGAVAPPRDTLLWYRLACTLPPVLPDASTAALEPADGAQARADYRVVIEGLGPCRGAPAAIAGAGPA